MLGSDSVKHIFLACEIKFQWIFAGTCYRPNLCSLLCSIFQSFIDLWVRRWHRSKSACSKMNSVQSSRPVREKGMCSDSNQTAWQLQMAVHNSLEMMPGMILNWSQTKFADHKQSLQWKALFESHVETSIDWARLQQASIFDLKRFFKQSANQNKQFSNHLLC